MRNWTTSSRRFCTFLTAISGWILTFSIGSAAQQPQSVAREGEGLDSISVGISVSDDVIAAYGTEYHLVKHREYSYEMIFKRAGVSFYYCAADPRKEIFLIEIEEPARVVTSKGIQLGVSRMGDVFEKYGEPSKGSIATYNDLGIEFASDIDDDGEDQADARVRIPETQIVEKSKGVAASVGTPSDPVTNGIANSTNRNDVTSTIRVNSSNKSNEIAGTENGTKARRVPFRDQLVRRIEIVEKSGLRQCDSRFPKNR